MTTLKVGAGNHRALLHVTRPRLPSIGLRAGPRHPREGWLAERMRVPAAALVSLPDAVNDVQAAALPAAGLTAWNALVELGRIKAGDLVLALGTGDVSMLALQIAKLHVSRIAITSSSDDKLAVARKLGADQTINYVTQADRETALLAQTGDAGADIVVESGGLATLSRSIVAAAPNARIVLIGALDSWNPDLPPYTDSVKPSSSTSPKPSPTAIPA